MRAARLLASTGRVLPRRHVMPLAAAAAVAAASYNITTSCEETEQWTDSQIQEKAQQIVQELLTEDALQVAETLRRKEAQVDYKRRLSMALASKDMEQLAFALAAARAEGLAECKELLLASSLVAPREHFEQAAHIAQDASAASAGAAAAAASEAATCESLDAASLKDRVVFLSQQLANQRILARVTAEVRLADTLEAADESSLASLQGALELLERERDAQQKINAAESRKCIEESSASDGAEVFASGRASTELELSQMEAEWRTAREERLRDEKASFVNEVAVFNKELANIEDTIVADRDFLHRSFLSCNLAAAVLGLEDAELLGRPAARELDNLRRAASCDAMSDAILSRLTTGALAFCMQLGMPSEVWVQERFKKRVNDLATAALLPPKAGLFEELVARAFRRLYILDGGEGFWQSEDSRELTQAESNLAVLARWARPLKEHEMAAALPNLEENLTGTCRERIDGWTQEVRDALVLRQTFLVVKARAQCLAAAVAPPTH